MEPSPDDTIRHQELAKEQGFVDKAYAALNAWWHVYREQQAKIAARILANPSVRTDRDALTAHYGDEAARLESAENHLVLGRLDMENGTQFHIGRVGLRESASSTDNDPMNASVSPSVGDAATAMSPGSAELEDALSHQLLIDWRAKVSRPFYQATAVQPMGVLCRRHLGAELHQVVSLEDELLNTGAADTTTLQGEGALLAALSSAREGHMQDIVDTIQAEQDRVIRADLNAFLMVQGGPGTGKTTVALHRAAYLPYAYRDLLRSTGVLVIGPNKTFLHYIERVLSAPGETEVVSIMMDEAFSRVKTVAERPELRALRGGTRWVKVAAAAVADLKRPPTTDQELNLGHVQLTLSIALIRDAMEAGPHADSTHNQRWAAHAKYLVCKLTAMYGGAEACSQDLEWMTEEIRSSSIVRHAIDQMYLPAPAPRLLERLYVHPDYLRRVVVLAKVTFTSRELQSLARPRGTPFTDVDVLILDELAKLLGPTPGLTGEGSTARAHAQRGVQRARSTIKAMDLGGGLVSPAQLAALTRGVEILSPLEQRAQADRSWAYGHVVVDEVQELTPMDWHLLLRRCPSRSFTAVGDVNQARYPGNTIDWQGLLGLATRANPVMEALTINYRIPHRIMDLAQRALAANGGCVPVPCHSARDLEDCLEITGLPADISLEDLMAPTRRILDQEVSRLKTEVGSGEGRLVVITNLGAGFGAALGLAQTDPLNDQVTWITPEASKGLEFDVVALVNSAGMAQVSAGDLYVVMTRPTRRLHIIKTGAVLGVD